MNARSRTHLARTAAAAALLFGLLAGACESTPGGEDSGTDAFLSDASEDGGTNPRDVADVDDDAATPPDVRTTGFDDHTVTSFEGVEALLAYLVGPEARGQTKFVITHFEDPNQTGIRFLDGTFYTLHDEWYWFRLLNGYAVPGDETVRPLSGHTFETVAAAVAWCREQTPLPLGLAFTSDGRLYSNRFYELSLVAPRQFGLGSVLHLAEVPGVRAERWAFELEYTDTPSIPELLHFFDVLPTALPAEAGDVLAWLVRSPAQEALVEPLLAARPALAGRILRYSDLAIPGEAEVYAEGLTAGRLHAIRAGESGLEEAGSNEVLVLEEVPDWLPPAAAVVTAVPQTPLAHIAILSRNRGIPDAYLGGVLDDPDIDQLSRARAPVLVHAAGPDTLDLLPLTNEEYARYRELATRPTVVVPTVDLTSAPLTVDLVGASVEEIDALRPLVGGKCAGMIPLLAILPDGRAALSAPDRPLAVTVKAYVEHLAPLRTTIAAMLDDDEFRSSARARLLALEGEEAYLERYPGAEAEAYVADFLARHPVGDVLGELVRAEGLQGSIRARDVAPTTLAAIEAELTARFGEYAPTQGLRFRSSSNVEDIEGFNGAGLYDSNSGFLTPSAATDPDDRKKSVAWALRKTWASYWSAEAFEERRLAGVDHLAGAMGVLVHARFDDDLETANGVFTFTILPPAAGGYASMEVNTQKGALSVTNPETEGGALPEVVRVTRAAPGAAPVVTRIRGSSEVPEGTVLLDDATLDELFAVAEDVTEAWLAEANRPLRAEWDRSTLTLDFEFRQMAPGWPAVADGTPFPARLLVKQARSLEPGLPKLATQVANLPFPRDVLARARRIDRRVCQGAAFTLVGYEAYTDPTRPPDIGYTVAPFEALLYVYFSEAVPGTGTTAGQEVALTHIQLRSQAHPGMADGGAWDLAVVLRAETAARAGFDRLEVDADGAWRIGLGEAEAVGAGLSCAVEALHASPEDYLRGILEARR